MDKDTLLKLLNEDLALEYSAAIQYVQHSAILQGVGFSGVRSHLMDHAREELEHARKLAERISYMGGVPEHVPSLVDIKTSADSRYALALDLLGERTAVARYKERVQMAKDAGEPGLALLLSEILLQEEEHEDDLTSVIGDSFSRGAIESEQAVGFLVKLASLEQSRIRRPE